VANKVRITEGRVQDFSCPVGKDYELYWDSGTPHLGVRVTATGARSYFYEGRLHGRTLRLTIGDVRSWALAKARVEVRRLSTLVDRGIDPRAEVKQQRELAEAERAAERRRGVLLSDAWDVYLKASKAKWGARHYEDHMSLAHLGGQQKRRGKGLTKPGPLSSLMALKLADLTAERIATWLKCEVEGRSTRAAHAYKVLRTFVSWTQDVPEYRGTVPSDACTARVVRDVVPAPRAKAGDCLQREQLPAWFKAVRSLNNNIIAAYLQSLLLTGARREELASLRWVDVDFSAWGSLKLRDKIEGERTIPLTPFVASLLAQLPRRNQWVFSSLSAKDGRLVEARKAHNLALGRAGLPHVSLHGLRRSFGTLSEWVEMPTGIVAQIQGHKPSAIAEKHYRRRPLDLLRMWHEQLEASILDQGGVQFVPPKTAGRLGIVAADGSVLPAA
jgi:integrase